MKGGAGRLGETRVFVGVNVPAERVRRMDAVATDHGLTRSDVLRDWLRRGEADYDRERGLLLQLKVVGGR